ncbi:unnamed protein product [Owenia fusiformis]|uniref:Uncharacterized protein n=1 Tax=Owenia fusiformis TaxID=6347 RepID=A0A8J1TQM1_OWEFU|nr:unnamed protein product [Owenia fusiformis]
MLVHLLGLHLVASLVMGQDTTGTEVPMVNMAPSNNSNIEELENEVFSMKVVHLTSKTDAIHVGWNMTYSKNITQQHINHFKVKYRTGKLNFNSDPLGPTNNSYWIMHLNHDTPYNVCVVASYRSDAGEQIEHVVCEELFTIPLIHIISLIVCLLVIGYFVVVFLLAYICVKRNQKKAEDQERLTSEEEEKLQPQENGRNGKPSGNNPYSSIEDKDVPWIESEAADA